LSSEKIRAALLIDADNIPVTQIYQALGKISEICNPVISKAFGDFTNSAKNWRDDYLHKFGISAVQHFPVSNYKNGADIAMCIEAMDIIRSGHVDAIILFSSDSDFGALAARIRDAGMEAIGVGSQQANEQFKAYFSTFIVVKPTATSTKIALPKLPEPNLPTKKPVAKQTVPADIRHIITNTIESMTNGSEDVVLSKVSVALKRRIDGFAPKNYGYASISKLMNNMNEVILTNGNKSVKLAKTW